VRVVDTQDEAAAPAEIKVVREPPMLPPPAFAQPAEAEAPAAAQPSDVRVVREEEAEEADDQFDADALSPLPVVAQPPAADELRRLEAEFAARDDDGRQASKDTQQRVLGLLSGALGKTKEYKDGRFMLIRGSEPEKGATGMVANPPHTPSLRCMRQWSSPGSSRFRLVRRGEDGISQIRFGGADCSFVAARIW